MVQLNSPACSHFVSAIVMETQRKFMVDTGAAVSLLSSKMWRAMGGKNAVISVGWKTVGWCGGQPCNGTGSVHTAIEICGPGAPS